MSTEKESPAAKVDAAEVVEGFKKWMEIANAFVYVEIASLVLLISCVTLWVKTSLMQYALSVACISLGICLVIQTAEFLKPGFLEKSEKPCSLFLLLWWCVGTGVITFKGPFLYTSNGWFGAWGGLIATVKWSVGLKSTNFANQEKGIKYLYAIFACSLVLVFSCIHPLKYNINKGNAAFGIATGTVSIVACAYHIATYETVPKAVMRVTIGILFALWVCVAGVCTFNGPFILTGNGYFVCWLGMLACLRLGMHELKHRQAEGTEGNGTETERERDNSNEVTPPESPIKWETERERDNSNDVTPPVSPIKSEKERERDSSSDVTPSAPPISEKDGEMGDLD